jgi:hypothetical protein
MCFVNSVKSECVIRGHHCPVSPLQVSIVSSRPLAYWNERLKVSFMSRALMWADVPWYPRNRGIKPAQKKKRDPLLTSGGSCCILVLAIHIAAKHRYFPSLGSGAISEGIPRENSTNIGCPPKIDIDPEINLSGRWHNYLVGIPEFESFLWLCYYSNKTRPKKRNV